MINEVRLIGRLGSDPQVTYTTRGDAVVVMSVATTEAWKDKATGEKKEATEWHRCVGYGRVAEICGEYIRKGDLVYVGGSLKTRKWQDKSGNDRYTTEVVMTTVKILSSASQKAQKSPRIDDQDEVNGRARVTGKKSTVGDFGAIEDDIPFAPCMARKWSLCV